LTGLLSVRTKGKEKETSKQITCMKFERAEEEESERG